MDRERNDEKEEEREKRRRKLGGTNREKPLNNTRKAWIACSLALFIKFIKATMDAEVVG